MKRFLFFAAVLAMIPAGCCPTRIVTVSPDTYRVGTYSTTITIPKTKTVTTSTRVYAADEDISLYLDLQAVGAAFAQSSTVEEFESLLNNSSYMLSNLDLNNDGYVDYLRVLETVEGRNHVFLIQAVLATNIYQDVATLVAEIPVTGTACVQIIGASYIYGPGFIIQPVYHTTPLIFTHLVRPVYNPWRSPWYWGHFPSCYRHPAPIFLSHYQAYVTTYMRNHRYCHEFLYAPACHYPDYERICRPDCRNNYEQQHPERAFSVRTVNMPVNTSASSAQQAGSSSPTRVVNARDVREAQQAATQTKTMTTAEARTASRTERLQNNTSTTRSASTQTGTRTRTATKDVSGTSRSITTTVKSKVNNTGTSNTRISTVSPSGTRSSVSRTSSSSQTTKSAATGSTTRGRTASGSSTGTTRR